MYLYDVQVNFCLEYSYRIHTRVNIRLIFVNERINHNRCIYMLLFTAVKLFLYLIKKNFLYIINYEHYFFMKKNYRYYLVLFLSKSKKRGKTTAKSSCSWISRGGDFLGRVFAFLLPCRGFRCPTRFSLIYIPIKNDDSGRCMKWKKK